MFSNISWNTYLVTVAIALVLYYSIVLYKYYLKEIREVASGQRKLRIGKGQEQLYGDNYSEQRLPLEFKPEPELAQVEELIERIKSMIADRTGEPFLKSEFVDEIRELFSEYPSVRKSIYRPSINDFIVSECGKGKTVVLEASEVDVLWEV